MRGSDSVLLDLPLFVHTVAPVLLYRSLTFSLLLAWAVQSSDLQCTLPTYYRISPACDGTATDQIQGYETGELGL